MTVYRFSPWQSLVVLALLTSSFWLLPVQAADPIVPAGAKLEKLFDGIVLTEGVAVAPDGMVYFSDITFTFKCRDAKGIICEGADYGGQRVIRTDMKTGMSYIIAGMFEGRPFNSPNDVTIDIKGRMYFSDPRYLGHEAIEQPVMAVYRIDTDGSIHRIITDAGKPNGVCVSPDQKTLYVVSNENGATALERLGNNDPDNPATVATPLKKGHMALMAYDLHADGSATFRKTLVDYYPEDGPDGLICDKNGNLYVAVRAANRPGIVVYSPAGKELAYIKTEIPTNVGFGRGAESKTLYITAGKSLFRIKLNAEGYQLPSAK